MYYIHGHLAMDMQCALLYYVTKKHIIYAYSMISVSICIYIQNYKAGILEFKPNRNPKPLKYRRLVKIKSKRSNRAWKPRLG